jgi:hypothetical protein
MKTKLFLTILICFTFRGICLSQNQQWAERYQGISQNSEDYATAIALDNSGNSYVTGYSDNAIATVKYNSSGVQQWAARYVRPDGSNSFGNSIAVYTDASQNTYVYVTGYTVVNGQGRDYVTIKYNSDGSYAWNPPVRTYNGPGNGDDAANHIEVDASGNTYVTGGSPGNNSGRDYVTIKYDLNGTQQWVARYNGSGNSDDYATSLKLDLNGKVFVTGQSIGYGTNYDMATVV